MRLFAMIVFLSLGACTSRVDQAERAYEIVKKSGRAAEICARGKAVADAYLDAGDSKKYSERSNGVAIECGNAEYDEKIGIFRMPDGDRKQIDADNLDFR